MNSRFYTFLLLLLILCTACSKWEESPVISQLNVINAYPAANKLNISINGNQATTLNFGDASGYVQQRAGKSTLQVRNGENPILEGDLYLAENRDYTLYILKNINKTDTVLIRIDSLPVLEVGRAKIRFANLSPEAGALRLEVKGPTAPTPVLPNRTFTSFTPYTTVDAGSGYTFSLKRGETELATLSGEQLQSERAYTIMAVGYATPPPGNSNIMLKLIENR